MPGGRTSSLLQQASSSDAGPTVGGQLLHLVPSTAADFALRLALAAGMTLIAIRRRWGWLVFLAATIAVPTLWLARLAPLVAVPRLWWEERRETQAPGTTTRKVVPSSPVRSTRMLAPFAARSSRAMVRPIPLPPVPPSAAPRERSAR